MECASAWDLDRQVVLVQLHHIILALRSGLKFGSKGRFDNSDKVHEHPLLCGAMALHKKLLSCTQTSSLDWASTDRLLAMSSTTPGDPKPVEVGASSNPSLTSAEPTAHLSVPAAPSSSPHRLPTSRVQKLTESDLLSPFCAVCRCPDIGEPVIIVALAALDAILDHARVALTAKGLRLAMDAALGVRCAPSDPATHEVLLARTVQVCASGMRHPAAAELPEGVYLQLVRRALWISLRPDATLLLRRVAEGSMTFLVTCLYGRVIQSRRVAGGEPDALSSAAYRSWSDPQVPAMGGRGVSASSSSFSGPKLPSAHSGSATPASTAATPLDGAAMMCYISSLISTEVTALDEEGNIVSADNSPQKTKGSSFAVVADQHSPTIQLEGLSLAQTALLTIQGHLSDPRYATLLSAVKNNLSRALLVAAMNTTHVVVFDLVLRIIHIVVESAAHDLVPQIFNFLRAIHLNPILAPTVGMDQISGVQSSNFCASSTSPTRSAATLLPLNSKVHENFASDTSLFDAALYPHSIGMLGCREILLESLAEFCSDPSFCSFCFLHYDLSWRCHSLLPQLCDVLVESACPARLNTNGSASSSSLLNNSGMRAQYRLNSRKTDVKDDDAENKGNDLLPISQVELVALDAATNMMTNFALRVSKHHYSTPQSASGECDTTAAWKETVEHMVAQKRLLLKFAALFEESPIKKGIPFLLENSIRAKVGEEKQVAESRRTWLVVAEPAGGREIGQCLYRLSHLLNKQILGNYIGELGKEKLPRPPEGEVVLLPDGTDTSAVEEWEKGRCGDHLLLGTVRFFEQQLEGFVGEFNFDNKSLLTSIRELIYHLCLPGESQKIDRIIEVFAKQWYSHNLNSERHINPFSSESGAFVLSFAIIMLNTDLHSGKMQKNMTPNDFRNINRGIDNGSSLPDEYLFAIYNDVKRHELVMAETINRGFANNVTWDLEINRFSSEGEDNFAFSHISDVIRKSREGGMEPHPMSASSAPTLTRFMRDENMFAELDPYAFNMMQSRCFLIFKRLLENSSAQVMRLNPHGSTLKDALDDAHAILPRETSALLSSIQGIKMLARAATALGRHEISDECMIALLSYTDVRFYEGMNAVDHLHRSLPILLLIKEIFSLLRWTAVSLQRGWSGVGDLLLNLYLLGVLAVAGDPPEAAPRCLVESVFQPPDLAAPPCVDPPPARRTVGWFAALWDSAFSGGDSEAGPGGARAGSGQALGGRLESRVRECIPDMWEVLGVVGGLPRAPCAGLLRALMDADCDTASFVSSCGAEPKPTVVCCYKLSFVTACVVATTTCPIKLDLFGLYLDYIQNVFSSLFAPIGSCGPRDQHTDNGHASTNHLPHEKKANPSTLWGLGEIMSKTITTVLDILKLLFIPKHDVEWSEAIILNIFRVFMSVPKTAFSNFVVLPLVKFLSSWIIDIRPIKNRAVGNHNDDQISSSDISVFQSSHASLVVRLLIDIIKQLDAPGIDSAVFLEIGTILLYFVKNALYDVVSETEMLLKLALSLEILRGRQRQHRQSKEFISVDVSSTQKGEKDLGEAQRASAPPTSSEEAISAEILGCCASNAIRLRKGLPTSFLSMQRVAETELQETSEDNVVLPSIDANWQQLWILSLQSLSGLILFTPQGSRTRSGAMLALRHAVLDMEPGTLDSVLIESVYDMVLFPLTEKICATPRTLTTLTVDSAGPSTLSASNSVAMKDSMESLGSWVSSLQQLVLPSLPVEVRPASAEDKSCIINILSKVFLHHMPILEGSPELLRSLWQRILNTLYVVYTVTLTVQDVVSDGCEEVPLPRNKCVEAECLMEEASFLQMAVEETVKNMVYVVATSGSNAHSPALSGQASLLSIFTRGIISPFPFSGPLIEFLDNMEAHV